MTHEEILELYRKTEFMVKDNHGTPVAFRVGDTPPNPVLMQKRFAIVTAWNPNNVVSSEEDNRRGNRTLEVLLRLSDFKFYPSVGRLGDHAEEGFTIEDIPEKEAVEFGKRFGQYAILFNDEKGPRFVFCELHRRSR